MKALTAIASTIGFALLMSALVYGIITTETANRERRRAAGRTWCAAVLAVAKTAEDTAAIFRDREAPYYCEYFTETR